ncbi:MAG: hypothetical protein WBF99_04865 [Xanthobacteraceae bacterium]
MRSFEEFRSETPHGYGRTTTDESITFFAENQTEEAISAFQPLALGIKEAAEAVRLAK